jgi:hypothetical protein
VSDLIEITSAVMRKARVSLGILLAWTFAASPVRLAAQQPPTFGSALAGLRFRTIGPANMSGRIVDIAVVEANPSTFYAASATGGL